MNQSVKSATPVNKEAIRILVQDYGYKHASEVSNIPEPTIRQWAHRGQWHVAKYGSSAAVGHSQALSRSVTSVVELHAQRLEKHRNQSLLHLAKYAHDAGRNLAKSKGDLRAAKAFQQVAAGRANLFPEAQPSTQVQVNVLSFAAIKQVDAGE